MEETTAEKKSKGFPWLLGCSIAIVATGLLCAGGAFFGLRALKDFAIEKSHEVLVDQVRGSGLPEDQILSLERDLGRVRDGLLDGRIDLERLEDVDQPLEDVLQLGAVQWYATHVLGTVDLPAEEKAAGRRTLERLQRGIQEGRLDLNQLQDVHLRVDEETRERGFDPEDVRTQLARAKESVDGLGIPDEPFQADVAGTFTEVVDGLLEDV